mmetsp:Transcript_65263/g.109372  ORF Transcript_65263/g.109372 Transcript_65263/m.109372 type:complete len:93 (-) Transcript_65263:1065-1343(-)
MILRILCGIPRPPCRVPLKGPPQHQYVVLLSVAFRRGTRLVGVSWPHGWVICVLEFVQAESQAMICAVESELMQHCGAQELSGICSFAAGAQ